MSALDTPKVSPTENVEGSRPARITLRSVLLGVVTIVALHIYTNHTGLVMGSSALVKSQYPMAMLIPFFLWLFVNIVLKAFFPSAALSGKELLVIYLAIPHLGSEAHPATHRGNRALPPRRTLFYWYHSGVCRWHRRLLHR